MMTVLAVGVLIMAGCNPKKDKPTTEPSVENVDANVLAVDSVEEGTTTDAPPLSMALLQGEWSEPTGDQHNLTLKSDGTFEYQDFEKTKGGDLIDVIRQGTYAVDGDSVRLKGNDGWQLSLFYKDLNGKLDEQHLTAGNSLDLVKE